MTRQQLIQAILRSADSIGNNARGEFVVLPLRQFGAVWFAEGRWWFSEEHTEINVYTAKQVSGQRFGHGEFEVTIPTPDQ